jgi:hypothetical protein
LQLLLAAVLVTATENEKKEKKREKSILLVIKIGILYLKRVKIKPCRSSDNVEKKNLPRDCGVTE